MLIIIRGPLGVGKTTIAQALAKKLDGVYLSVDAALEELGLDHSEEDGGIPLKNFLAANQHIVPAIKKALSAKKDIIVDGNFYLQQQVEHLTNLFETVVFPLTATLKKCIERDAARKRAYGKDATTAVYTMVTAFSTGTMIDTEKKTPEQTLHLLLNHIKRKQ